MISYTGCNTEKARTRDAKGLFRRHARSGQACRTTRLRRVTTTFWLVVLTCLHSSYADTLTVGPGGEHATIQAAVDDAVGRGGGHEIHIAEGTFTEAVVLFAVTAQLDISGGWSAGFATRTDDPALTIISGGNTNRVVDLEGVTGQVKLENLTLAEGFHDTRGAGVHVLCADCEVDLQDVHLRDNVVSREIDDELVNGSALYVMFQGAGFISMDRCEVRDNRITGLGGATGTVFLEVGLFGGISEILNSIFRAILCRAQKVPQPAEGCLSASAVVLSTLATMSSRITLCSRQK